MESLLLSEFTDANVALELIVEVEEMVLKSLLSETRRYANLVWGLGILATLIGTTILRSLSQWWMEFLDCGDT